MPDGEKKFCGQCGNALVIRPTGQFDTSTGQPTYRPVCATYGCVWNFTCKSDEHAYGFLGARCLKCGSVRG